jgi:RNase P subunit RPR2
MQLGGGKKIEKKKRLPRRGIFEMGSYSVKAALHLETDPIRSDCSRCCQSLI